MNIDNVLDLICVVVFSMSPKFGGLGPKAQYLVIYFDKEKDIISHNSTLAIFSQKARFID